MIVLRAICMLMATVGALMLFLALAVLPEPASSGEADAQIIIAVLGTIVGIVGIGGLLLMIRDRAARATRSSHQRHHR